MSIEGVGEFGTRPPLAGAGRTAEAAMFQTGILNTNFQSLTEVL
jgi:hypothetical protein